MAAAASPSPTRTGQGSRLSFAWASLLAERCCVVRIKRDTTRLSPISSTPNPPPPLVSLCPRSLVAAFVATVRQAFRNRPFVIYFLSQLVAGFASAATDALLPFYIQVRRLLS